MRGHICKKGRSWCVVIYLGRDPHTKKKKQRWFTFPSKREAEARLAQLLMQVQTGGIPQSRVRLSEFLDRWLHDCVEGQVKETTRETYEYAVKQHIVPHLGFIPLPQLSSPAIQEWVSKLHKQKLSAATVHQSFRVLRTSLRQAVAWNMLPKSPADTVKAPRLAEREFKVWDEEQIRLFLAQARRSSSFFGLYVTAVLTGMRLGELLGLRWKDIDWTFGRISVRQTLVRIGKQIIVGDPKSTKSRRTISMPPIVIEALREIQGVQKEMKRKFGPEYHDAELVFCQPNGKPLHRHNLTQRDFRQITKDAGLPRIRFHDLRHSYATLLLREGVHPKLVQERLGHSRVEITLDTYSHVLPGMQEGVEHGVVKRLGLEGIRKTDA